MIGPVWKHLKLGPKGPTELVVNHMSWDVFFFFVFFPDVMVNHHILVFEFSPQKNMVWNLSSLTTKTHMFQSWVATKQCQWKKDVPFFESRKWLVKYPRGFGRNSKKILRHYLMAEISFDIIWHQSSFIPNSMHPFACNSTQTWRIFIWVDNKMLVVGGLTPCSTLVLFASSKKPAHWISRISRISLDSDVLADVIFRWLGSTVIPETLATFPNSSETIPYHPCMDYLPTAGGKNGHI